MLNQLSAPRAAYVLAVAASGLALLLNLVLAPWLESNVFPPFLAAVMVATWFGGLGPALLATALTGLATLYFFLPPAYSLALTEAGTLLRLGLFLASAILIAALGALLQTARSRAEAAAREARHHEASLRESEGRFRSLLEGVRDDAIVVLDPDGRVVSWNAGAERILGYDKSEILGLHFSVFHTPEERESGVPARELAASAGSGRFKTESWRVRKGGGRFWAEVVVTPLRSERGELRGFSKLMRDVTARKNAEEAIQGSEVKFRGLVELAPDGIVIVDRDGRILLANSQATKMFGYTAEELVGQPVEVLVPDAARPAHAGHRRAYSREPRTRPMGLGFDLLGQRKDGQQFPVEISLSPMQSDEGLLVISVIRDITDRKETEKRIRTLNEDLARRVAELDAVNRELEAFSYSVSHDLRAPLRGIDGFSQALLEEYGEQLDAQGQEYLRRVRAATQRMGALIDDLLNLARVTRQEMRREPVDLSALAGLVVAQLQRGEPGRRVEVVIQEGLTARGDPRLLRLVLENLLGNAWKFTGKQPRAIIELGAITRDGQRVFYVRDNGVGFDMAYAGKLFGAFQRLHAMTEFPGTGIGLATVQRVVTRHRGRVWAEAAVGQGATFFFTL